MLPGVLLGRTEPDREAVATALVEAVVGLQERYGHRGGYVWAYSADGEIRSGEGNAGVSAAWVQPPGTPTVGEAFLAAWEATSDRRCLAAAREAAGALVRGQLHSGGWYYRIEFAADLRKKYRYRVDGGSPPAAAGPAGWETWRKRRNKGNQSMLDDDTTQSALRFLMRIDRALEGRDQGVRDAVDHGLRALLGTQYPVGAWSHNFDAFPDPGPDEQHYPVLRASYPDEWSRTWPKAWEGCYHLNDNITTDCIRTLLLAHELYGSAEALAGAKRGGEFLLRAQMPDPQPAWCQQYDREMKPVWERKFEPPAITGGESQGAMKVLLALHAATDDDRYLEPLPRALDYLEESQTAPGKLARYYELRTNRPLYFTKDYQLTHDSGDVPDHYAFTVGSGLEGIRRAYDSAVAGKPPPTPGAPSDARIARILAAADADGLWLEDGVVRDENGRKVKPEQGILNMATVTGNMRALAFWLQADGPTP